MKKYAKLICQILSIGFQIFVYLVLVSATSARTTKKSTSVG